MKHDPKERCDNCYFSKIPLYLPYGDQRGCHRYPPTWTGHNPPRHEEGHDYISGWTRVAPNDWCGEWKKDDDKPI